ncbi:TetR/AcrR family transcriptional regulator [Lactobacillus mulieris]|uniref:TetR/AcrR family transcriptional regulator n=1 Tax=Lactobacillus mulieris TaxID=2508708 RepID=A0AAW5X0H5_9LACO|nr:TetR/AcrR family transcriptional regulator [Lactobacillus mulieris]MCZ3622793.1 TetR/AcrR family transcriptional regulator [Lactobacillus mulieris]MCZ3624473.1 TetR/AcrR family transcriptional regulator [Lactobacillus mulieris]MCZ3636781.1 TetR/AcrR family transcriptional regulator [Lactobacillus mulieris]MCZ3690593.1 TetR/AcrR family transcriptional regulator [Lactobacillus mulieris]MCZ3696644.1 TetR/AcrR family transcriptional regulator [Lactobacillus mulieris]
MRREIKKELNRKKIIEAAKTLFLNKGIDATNVRDISAVSGISYVTMYKYFSDKNELVQIVCQEIIDEVITYAYSQLHNEKLTFFEKLHRLSFEENFKKKYGPNAFIDFSTYISHDEELKNYITKKIDNSWMKIVEAGRQDNFIHSSASNEQICKFLSLIFKLDHDEFKKNINEYGELFLYGLAGYHKNK